MKHPIQKCRRRTYLKLKNIQRNRPCRLTLSMPALIYNSKAAAHNLRISTRARSSIEYKGMIMIQIVWTFSHQYAVIKLLKTYSYLRMINARLVMTMRLGQIKRNSSWLSETKSQAIIQQVKTTIMTRDWRQTNCQTNHNIKNCSSLRLNIVLSIRP